MSKPYVQGKIPNCPNLNCLVHTSRYSKPGSEYEYDAVLFNVGNGLLFDLTKLKLELPVLRNSSQFYVMFSLNPPSYSPIPMSNLKGNKYYFL